ncbi:MAG TPA: XdhC family protein [Acidimicrobiia bacterium]|jgi:xanthine dehydrogenase accessory factor|nr:XdhC family protein [Acidimicrobiia bacterium]
MVSSPLAAVRDLERRERFGAVATVVAGPDLGAKAVIESGAGYIAGSLPDGIATDVLADAGELIAHEQSRTLQYGEREVFIETLAPQPRLLIFGAGHIAQSLAAMAPELGYQVIVADARKTWATPERFPHVDRLVVSWPDEVFEEIEPDARTYVVLLSHDARFEDPVFPAVRHAPVRYLGALGSRRTSRARADRLREAGWSDEEIARIHAPIGIDIGAEHPSEVAVSILAEMVQARYGAGTGLSLRGVDGRIHAQRGEEAGTS